jgi:5-methylcytosine-specific restriction enzyme subunit McrC
MQGGRLFCLIEEGDQGRLRFQTRPDIIIRDRQSNAPIAIVDTKWKHLSPAIEDAKHGVSQTDVYQMMAYGQLYTCPDLLLLYPHHFGLGSELFAKDYRIQGSMDRLHVRSIDIAQHEVRIVADLAAMFKLWQAEHTLVSG